MSCSSRARLLCAKEFNPPFPFPPRGKPGRGGFPPRRKHAARQPKPLARIDAAGSPRGLPPPCVSPAVQRIRPRRQRGQPRPA
jgi:hypothetical protein